MSQNQVSEIIRNAIYGKIDNLQFLSFCAVGGALGTIYVGIVPGFPGAHSQGESLDELNTNLKEVIEMLLEDGEPDIENEFIGTQNVMM